MDIKRAENLASAQLAASTVRGNLLSALPELETAKQVAKLLSEAFPESRSLAVGGFVRDLVLGKQSKDIDIEVFGVELDQLHQTLAEAFPGRVNAVGKSFGVLKLSLPDQAEIDIAIPRRDSKVAPGHTGFNIQGDPNMSPLEAAKRRDLTINAISLDLNSGEMVDPFEGLADLENGVIRVVDPETFVEDPLRVYRAVQFAARFGFEIEPDSKGLMQEMVASGQLSELPRERVGTEVEKLMLRSARPSLGFELMREIGIIDRHFPELAALISTPQDPHWHPEGSVWNHTMMVVDEAAKVIHSPEAEFTAKQKLQIMLSALMHDLGKQSTTYTDDKDGRIRAPGHEHAADPFICSLGTKFALSNADLSAIQTITYHHMRPQSLERPIAAGEIEGETLINETRKLLRDVNPVGFNVFLGLAQADALGRGETPDQVDRLSTVNTLRDTAILHDLNAEPLLQGRDLIAIGIVPGPQIGEIIREVEKIRDKGKLSTQDEALMHVKTKYLVFGRDLIQRGIEAGPEVGKRMQEIKELIKSGELGSRAEILSYIDRAHINNQ